MEKKKKDYSIVLDLFIKEFQRTGCPPPLSFLEKSLPKSINVRNCMKNAVKDGRVSQPYRGCYFPLTNSKGQKVVVTIEVQQKSSEEIAPYISSKKTKEFEEAINPSFEKKIEDFERNVNFRVETIGSQLKKLTSMYKNIQEVPEQLKSLQKRFKTQTEEFEDLEKIKKKVEKIAAWKEKVNRVLSS